MENKYIEEIVNILLRKYYERVSKHKTLKNNRRISISPNEILKSYFNYNVSISDKDLVNDAIKFLIGNGFVSAYIPKFTEDYKKVYLIDDKIHSLEAYASDILGITPRSLLVEELNSIIKTYDNSKATTMFYISELKNEMYNTTNELDIQKVKDVLKILSFLENNDEMLYTREASMLIFGDSKYLENKRKSFVNTILTKYFEKNGEIVFEDENLFARFGVYDADQELCIKGPVKVTVNEKILDINGLSGGVSFSNKDIDKIKTIEICCENVMTIENKTSFLRMNDDCCYVYLGGYATNPQITFIKKIIKNNPNKKYFHFGDIDAGGFWIHKTLCQKTEQYFELFHMSSDDIAKDIFKNCLNELSKSDIKRLNNLANDDMYADCIKYMLEHKVKLEQEIISLDLSKS